MGTEPDTNGLIRTLLLQPLRPSYSQAIMLSGSASAGPLARVIAPLPRGPQAQPGRVGELSTVINSE